MGGALGIAISQAAWAAGGGGHGPAAEGEDPMLLVVFVVLAVGVAYVATHTIVERLHRRYLFVSGIEYILLGVLLGPYVPGVHAFEDMTGLSPIIALGVGWVGLVYGMDLNLRELVEARDSSAWLGTIEAGLTLCLVTLFSHEILAGGFLGPITGEQAWICAGVLGCTAAAGSSSAVDLLEQYHSRPDGLIPTLRRASRVGDLISIGAFGVLFATYHQGLSNTPRPLVASEWFLITIVTGAVLGMLFTVFLGEHEGEDDNQSFLAMVGIIALACGAAFFLNLTPLLVNLVLGVVLVNTSRVGEQIRNSLQSSSKPLTLLLLIFAGAKWTPVEVIPAVGLALSYLALRTAAKIFSAWLASLGRDLRRDLFRGLMAQGDVAIAMALSFRLVYEGPAVDLAYNAILFSVVLNELIAPRILNGLLIDAGELRHDAWRPAGTGEA
ncbi:MAG: hypothetical protein EP330_22510 [Deltaproteobacteria bacterium]|nr:MAG: hypothetical protein EP330_22510 [Deltaproteobacteria bacterium]